MHRSGTRAKLATWALGMVLLAACGPSPASNAPSSSAGGSAQPAAVERTLAIAVRVEPQSIASLVTGATGVQVTHSTRLFNASLFLIDDKNLPQPYLAEALPQLNTASWVVSPDGKMQTTYHLKPNLVWHDGSPLTADDFAFAYQVYSNVDLGFATAAPITFMSGVRAADDRTVVIDWQRPYALAATLQTSRNISSFPPLPRRLLERVYGDSQPDAFLAHPYWTREFIGLGPYRVEQWEPGAFLNGEAFDQHVIGRPKIDRVHLVFIPDSNTALANLLSGGVQFAGDNALGFQQGLLAKRAWAGNGGGKLLVAPDLFRATYAQLNPEYGGPSAIRDVRVRQALAHAMDKRELNDTLYEGEGIITETLLPPSIEFYPTIDRATTHYAFDPRRAEQFMASAGYSKGVDGLFAGPEGKLSLELKVNASALYENERSIMASQWRRAGFDVQEATLPAAQAQDGQARASFPGFYSFSTGVSVSALSNFVTSSIPKADNRWRGNNRGSWSNAEYDRLSTQLDITLDQDERIRQIAQLSKLLSDELPAIPLYYDLGAVAHVSALTGPGDIGPETSGGVTWNVHTWELR